MQAIIVLFFILVAHGCSSKRTPSEAWVSYVDACTARVYAQQQPLCSAFPFPPGSDKNRAATIGAVIGAAQDVGEALAPLVIPALAAKGILE